MARNSSRASASWWPTMTPRPVRPAREAIIPRRSTRRSAFAQPVVGRRGKYRIAARRLGRAVQGIGGRAPDRIVRCGPMRLQRRLVPVDLKEVIGVRVLLVVQHVEAKAARLILLGA